SQKRFDEHLDLFLSLAVNDSSRKIRCIGDSGPPTPLPTCCIQTLHLQLHSWDRSPRLDAIHKREHPGQMELDGRIASYELAARLQLSASDALDISKES